MSGDSNLKLTDKVTAIKGVGKKRAELLEKMNIHTVEELLYLFPRKYEDRRHSVTIMEAPFNQDVLLEVRVVTKQISGNPYSKKRLLREFLRRIIRGALNCCFLTENICTTILNPVRR